MDNHGFVERFWYVYKICEHTANTSRPDLNLTFVKRLALANKKTIIVKENKPIIAVEKPIAPYVYPIVVKNDQTWPSSLYR